MPDSREQGRLRRLFNRPVEKAVDPALANPYPQPPNTDSRFQEIGLTGVERAAGYIFAQWRTELRYLQGLRQFQMAAEGDATIGAMLFALNMLMRQVKWTVEAASSSQADQEAADFLRSCMDDLGTGSASTGWTEFLADCFTMLQYGWSWFELVYKIRQGRNIGDVMDSQYNDGRVGWRKFSFRKQLSMLRWEFNDDGSVACLTQIPPPDYQMRYIPREKSMHFIMGPAQGSPEGHSILLPAMRAWYLKTKVENLELIAYERNAAGLPIAYIPMHVLDPTTDAEKEELKYYVDLVSKVRKDEHMGLAMPSDPWEGTSLPQYKLDLLSAGGGGSKATADEAETIIQRLDQRIAMTVMADFLLLGSNQVGSFALADSKTSLFGIALGSILDLVAAVANDDAVPALFAMNSASFPGLSALPKIVHGDIRPPSVTDLAPFITSLAQAGMTFSPAAQDVLLAAANLPADASQTTTPASQQITQKTQQLQTELSLLQMKQMSTELGKLGTNQS